MESFLGAVGVWPAHLGLLVLAFPLAAIDQAEHRLPDALVLPAWLGSAAWFGAVGVGTGQSEALSRAFGVAAAMVLGMWLISELPGEPLGFGDVKLSGLLALHGGWYSEQVGVFSVALGIVVGGAHAVWWVTRGHHRASEAIALGPHLLLGWWGALTLHAMVTPSVLPTI